MKNNKILHNFFIVLLGFCFCLCPFLSMPLKEEKASALSEEEYSIYNYEWANYFDISKKANDSSLRIVTDTTVSDYPFLRWTVGSLPRPSVSLGSISELLPDIIYDSTHFYTFSYDWSIRSSIDGEVELCFRTIYTGGFQDIGPFVSGYTWFIPADWSSNDSNILRAVFINDNLEVELPSGTVVDIYNIAVYAGENTYDYTPYFYSLESLPDIPDNPDNPDNPDIPDNPDNPVTGYPISSFFYGADIDFNVLMSDGSTMILPNVPLYYIFGGLSFSPYRQYILDNVEGDISGVSITINFRTFVLGFNFHVQGIGNVDSFSQNFSLGLVANEVLGNSITARFTLFPTDTMVGYGIQTLNYDISEYRVTSIQNWIIYDIDNLTDLVVIDYSWNYNNGYENGVEYGYQNGLKDAENLLKSKWFEQGRNAGYDEGLSKGNTWAGLFNGISSVPVNLLASIFSFDILGFNVKNVFYGILSAMIIFALVVFFTKGKSE